MHIISVPLSWCRGDWIDACWVLRLYWSGSALTVAILQFSGPFLLGYLSDKLAFGSGDKMYLDQIFGVLK